MNFGNMSGWGMGFWWIGGAIMMAFFVWFLYSLIRNTDSNNRFRHDTPREILSKRYARGDISKEEYNRILNELP